MAPGERRRAPAAAARLALLGAANLLALAVLVRLLAGGGGELVDAGAPHAGDAAAGVAVQGLEAGPGPAEGSQVREAVGEERAAAVAPGAALEMPAEPAAGAPEQRPADGDPPVHAGAAPVGPAPTPVGPGMTPVGASKAPVGAGGAPVGQGVAPVGAGVAPVRGAPAGVEPGPPVARDRALERRLRSRVTAAVADASKRSDGAVRAENTTVALCVRALGRPGTLAALDADRPLRPASNMKLVTAAATLVLLGPDAALETRFEALGEVRHGVLEGDLVARAGGDPFYDPAADGRVEHLLAPLAQALRAADVRRVAGDLVLDEGGFEPPGPGPGWPDSGQHWAEHCALAGGFSANAGCLTAVVGATRAGEAARAELHPAHHGLERTGSVRTGAPPLDVRVGVQGPRVVLDGTVPAGVARWTARFAHPDPVELFGRELLAALRAGGVEVAGELVRARRPEQGPVLAVLRTPVLDLLGPINTDSNNAVADQLFLALGGLAAGAPTRAGGARATHLALERLGVPSAGLVQVDGSGLSREDRISARQLAALLDAVLALGDERARLFQASLAVGGETGTLRERMKEPPLRGRVFAKTGFIGGTSALSGLVETAAGERLVFSILVEYPRFGGLNNTVWKPLQDELVAELARHGS